MKKWNAISRSACGAALAVFLVAPMARAADDREDGAAAQGGTTRSDADLVAQASAHFDRALTLFDEGDFGAALIDFRRAQAIKPSYKLRFNIGGVCLELRDYACALSELQAYLDEGGERVGAERREDVRKKIARAAVRVATVEVVTTPGAQIAIDDDVVGVAPLGRPVVINGGRHRISAQKPGWTSKASVVDASATDALRVVLELQEIAAPAAAPVSRAPEASAPSPSRWTTASFTGLGAGGVLLTGAVIAGLTANAANADVRAERFAGGAPPPELQERADRAQALAMTANALGAAGVVTLGVTLGVTLFRPVAPGRAAQVGISINPSGGGLRGTF